MSSRPVAVSSPPPADEGSTDSEDLSDYDSFSSLSSSDDEARGYPNSPKSTFEDAVPRKQRFAVRGPVVLSQFGFDLPSADPLDSPDLNPSSQRNSAHPSRVPSPHPLLESITLFSGTPNALELSPLPPSNLQAKHGLLTPALAATLTSLSSAQRAALLDLFSTTGALDYSPFLPNSLASTDFDSFIKPVILERIASQSPPPLSRPSSVTPFAYNARSPVLPHQSLHSSLKALTRPSSPNKPPRPITAMGQPFLFPGTSSTASLTALANPITHPHALMPTTAPIATTNTTNTANTLPGMSPGFVPGVASPQAHLRSRPPSQSSSRAALLPSQSASSLSGQPAANGLPGPQITGSSSGQQLVSSLLGHQLASYSSGQSSLPPLSRPASPTLNLTQKDSKQRLMRVPSDASASSRRLSETGLMRTLSGKSVDETMAGKIASELDFLNGKPGSEDAIQLFNLRVNQLVSPEDVQRLARLSQRAQARAQRRSRTTPRANDKHTEQGFPASVNSGNAMNSGSSLTIPGGSRKMSAVASANSLGTNTSRPPTRPPTATSTTARPRGSPNADITNPVLDAKRESRRAKEEAEKREIERLEQKLLSSVKAAADELKRGQLTLATVADAALASKKPTTGKTTAKKTGGASNSSGDFTVTTGLSGKNEMNAGKKPQREISWRSTARDASYRSETPRIPSQRQSAGKDAANHRDAVDQRDASSRQNTATYRQSQYNSGKTTTSRMALKTTDTPIVDPFDSSHMDVSVTEDTPVSDLLLDVKPVDDGLDLIRDVGDNEVIVGDDADNLPDSLPDVNVDDDDNGNDEDEDEDMMDEDEWDDIYSTSRWNQWPEASRTHLSLEHYAEHPGHLDAARPQVAWGQHVGYREDATSPLALHVSEDEQGEMKVEIRKRTGSSRGKGALRSPRADKGSARGNKKNPLSPRNASSSGSSQVTDANDTRNLSDLHGETSATAARIERLRRARLASRATWEKSDPGNSAPKIIRAAEYRVRAREVARKTEEEKLLAEQQRRKEEQQRQREAEERRRKEMERQLAEEAARSAETQSSRGGDSVKGQSRSLRSGEGTDDAHIEMRIGDPSAEDGDGHTIVSGGADSISDDITEAGSQKSKKYRLEVVASDAEDDKASASSAKTRSGAVKPHSKLAPAKARTPAVSPRNIMTTNAAPTYPQSIKAVLDSRARNKRSDTGNDTNPRKIGSASVSSRIPSSTGKSRVSSSRSQASAPSLSRASSSSSTTSTTRTRMPSTPSNSSSTAKSRVAAHPTHITTSLARTASSQSRVASGVSQTPGKRSRATTGLARTASDVKSRVSTGTVRGIDESRPPELRDVMGIPSEHLTGDLRAFGDRIHGMVADEKMPVFALFDEVTSPSNAAQTHDSRDSQARDSQRTDTGDYSPQRNSSQRRSSTQRLLVDDFLDETPRPIEKHASAADLSQSRVSSNPAAILAHSSSSAHALNAISASAATDHLPLRNGSMRSLDTDATATLGDDLESHSLAKSGSSLFPERHERNAELQSALDAAREMALRAMARTAQEHNTTQTAATDTTSAYTPIKHSSSHATLDHSDPMLKYNTHPSLSKVSLLTTDSTASAATHTNPDPFHEHHAFHETNPFHDPNPTADTNSATGTPSALLLPQSPSTPAPFSGQLSTRTSTFFKKDGRTVRSTRLPRVAQLATAAASAVTATAATTAPMLTADPAALAAALAAAGLTTPESLGVVDARVLADLAALVGLDAAGTLALALGARGASSDGKEAAATTGTRHSDSLSLLAGNRIPRNTSPKRRRSPPKHRISGSAGKPAEKSSEKGSEKSSSPSRRKTTSVSTRPRSQQQHSREDSPEKRVSEKKRPKKSSEEAAWSQKRAPWPMLLPTLIKARHVLRRAGASNPASPKNPASPTGNPRSPRNPTSPRNSESLHGKRSNLRRFGSDASKKHTKTSHDKEDSSHDKDDSSHPDDTPAEPVPENTTDIASSRPLLQPLPHAPHHFLPPIVPRRGTFFGKQSAAIESLLAKFARGEHANVDAADSNFDEQAEEMQGRITTITRSPQNATDPSISRNLSFPENALSGNSFLQAPSPITSPRTTSLSRSASANTDPTNTSTRNETTDAPTVDTTDASTQDAGMTPTIHPSGLPWAIARALIDAAYQRHRHQHPDSRPPLLYLDGRGKRGKPALRRGLEVEAPPPAPADAPWPVFRQKSRRPVQGHSFALLDADADTIDGVPRDAPISIHSSSENAQPQAKPFSQSEGTLPPQALDLDDALRHLLRGRGATVANEETLMLQAKRALAAWLLQSGREELPVGLLSPAEEQSLREKLRVNASLHDDLAKSNIDESNTPSFASSMAVNPSATSPSVSRNGTSRRLPPLSNPTPHHHHTYYDSRSNTWSVVPNIASSDASSVKEDPVDVEDAKLMFLRSIVQHSRATPEFMVIQGANVPIPAKTRKKSQFPTGSSPDYERSLPRIDLKAKSSSTIPPSLTSFSQTTGYSNAVGVTCAIPLKKPAPFMATSSFTPPPLVIPFNEKK